MLSVFSLESPRRRRSEAIAQENHKQPLLAWPQTLLFRYWLSKTNRERGRHLACGWIVDFWTSQFSYSLSAGYLRNIFFSTVNHLEGRLRIIISRRRSRSELIFASARRQHALFGDNTQQTKFTSILTWYIKKIRHRCNVFHGTLLQRTSSEVNVYQMVTKWALLHALYWKRELL